MIKVFLPYRDTADTLETMMHITASPLVSGVELVETTHKPLCASETIKKIAHRATDCEFALIYTKYNTLEPCYLALDRFVQIARDSHAGMLYSDYYSMADGVQKCMPVIDCQFGALRDDFNFGSVLFFDAKVLRQAAEMIDDGYKAAGLYALRLAVSRLAPIVHINEYLYQDIENDNRKSGEKLFDYVDPRNRASQIEMEQACTEHLKAIGGYLEPKFREIDLTGGDFPCEASVIIPVRNRIRTIRDAVVSAATQITNFDYNVIVVDNHSTDGTTEELEKLASELPNVIHIKVKRPDLGIGGCWNLAIDDSRCGRYAVQLDSDDLYSDDNTLQRVVNAFHEQKCGMVVGTYMLTDIDKRPIPPGVIDHKEWTPDNGRNNALRINGLGAPRAFYTPLVRQLHFPNTSYGEDYAMGLNISRHYQIGRIYDVLYLCRRWDDNSDAALDINKLNANNLYKDRIRTWELEARIAMNKEQK